MGGMPKVTFEEVALQGLDQATVLEHRMQLESSSRDFALYICERCRQSYTVGYPVEAKFTSPPRMSGLQLMSASVNDHAVSWAADRDMNRGG